MSSSKHSNLLLMVAIAIFMVAIVFDIAYGDEGHGHHHDDGGGVTNLLTGGDLTGGDNTASNVASIAGSRSYGISGSDMDIGQCMYHQGALTLAVGFRNKFCEGMDMIRVGMVEAGVLHICKQTKIGRNYDTLQDCKNGLVIAYTEPQTDKPTEHTSDDDDDDRYEALYADFQAFKDQSTQRTAEAEKVAQRANAMARQVQTQQQAPDYAAERRARARAALKGEE